MAARIAQLGDAGRDLCRYVRRAQGHPEQPGQPPVAPSGPLQSVQAPILEILRGLGEDLQGTTLHCAVVASKADISRCAWVVRMHCEFCSAAGFMQLAFVYFLDL